MKRMLLGMSVVAAMLFVASSALAGGVNLAWNNCPSEGGVQNRTSACAANNGSSGFTGSFQPNVDQAACTGIEIIIDLIAGDGTSTIPVWWDTACRPGFITMNSLVNGNNTICNDWANGQGQGGLAAYAGPAYSGGAIAAVNLPAHRRVVGGIAVAPSAAADVFAANEYFAFNCLVSNAKTVGTGSCAGCATPVCIVLNSIHIVSGTDPGQIMSGGAAAADSDKITWQGVGPSCALVPTKNATWGQVKALYH